MTTPRKALYVVETNRGGDSFYSQWYASAAEAEEQMMHEWRLLSAAAKAEIRRANYRDPKERGDIPYMCVLGEFEDPEEYNNAHYATTLVEALGAYKDDMENDLWLFDNGVQVRMEEYDHSLQCFDIEYKGKSFLLVPDSRNQMKEIIHALNSGEDPISGGWETGDGETIEHAMMRGEE